jgi:hypothetical protein
MQPEFFDHVLRSSESYSQKWEYVRKNPMRAGFVTTSDVWPFEGEIEDLMLSAIGDPGECEGGNPAGINDPGYSRARARTKQSERITIARQP